MPTPDHWTGWPLHFFVRAVNYDGSDASDCGGGPLAYPVLFMCDVLLYSLIILVIIQLVRRARNRFKTNTVKAVD